MTDAKLDEMHGSSHAHPTTARARRSALDRRLAMRLAADENARFLAQLHRLAPSDWQAPTDCPAWDVRSLVAHVVGMAEFAAFFPEQLKQLLAARKRGGVFIDALTGLQVDKHRGKTTEQLVARHGVVGRKAARGRRRTPGVVRRITMPVPQAVGGVEESWKLGFLVDVILTRDTWMHRIDIARATGRDLELTPEHDGAIVADVVQEWAARHGQPCSLELTGPAGGSWTFGRGGPTLSYDAVEFCRALSGRGEPPLGTEVPF
jgi:uncharacterized protein (TIGR03083 family)